MGRSAIIADDVTLRYRAYPASRPRQEVFANRDIIRLFERLRKFINPRGQQITPAAHPDRKASRQAEAQQKEDGCRREGHAQRVGAAREQTIRGLRAHAIGRSLGAEREGVVGPRGAARVGAVVERLPRPQAGLHRSHPGAASRRRQVAFERLFGEAGTTDPQVRLALRKEDRSILDAIHADIRRLRGKLGGTDRGKIDQYLEAVRDVEFIAKAGLRAGHDAAIALDVASTHFYRVGRYHLRSGGGA